MRKGISPVVAVVLLIAIAVIAAVAVWFWVSPLTAKPATAGTAQKTISVVSCTISGNNANLKINNPGGLTVTEAELASADIYEAGAATATVTDLSSVNLSTISSISPGSQLVVTLNNSAAGLQTGTQYELRITGYPDAPFSCT